MQYFGYPFFVLQKTANGVLGLVTVVIRLVVEDKCSNPGTKRFLKQMEEHAVDSQNIKKIATQTAAQV